MPQSFLAKQLTGAKLAWNIFFYLGHIGVFAYGWWKQAGDERLAGLNTLKFSVWISRGAGLALGIDALLLILPVLRNMIRILRPPLANIIPLDENIWFHRQIAYSTLFFTIMHTTAHYVNFINVERTQIRKETAWGIHYSQPGGFTGHVMLLLMFLMYTTAHAKIRHQNFEVFWYTHNFCAFLFLMGLYTHATGCFVRGALPDTPVKCLGYGSWTWTIWAGIAYFCERVYREIRARRNTRITGVFMHPSGAMEIRFVKPSFNYVAGQWLFLNVPDVSKWQWHPFTISSAPSDPYVSVHIRQAGDFTKALGERLGATAKLAAEITASSKGDGKGLNELGFFDVSGALGAEDLPTLRIDGPYGAPAEDVFNYEVAVLVGTGIGVTPFASILKNILHQQRRGKLGALRRTYFIWVNRDTGSFEWFQALLAQLEDQQTDPNFLRISTYLTQKLDEDTIQNIVVNDPGSEFDALTSLRTRTHFGRPDWTQIFDSIRNSIEAGDLPGRESSLNTTVGTFYCGPSVLAKTLADRVWQANKKGGTVRFKFKKEHF